MRRLQRAFMVAVVLGLTTACGHPPAVSTSAGSTPPASTAVDRTAEGFRVGGSAWVAVSVARLWDSPSAPWPVDAPALTSPVHFRNWLSAMTLDQRRGLFERSQSEALYAERVVVVGLRPHWAQVVVPSQPTPKDRRGYPGWIPLRQLTARAPLRTPEVATVISRTAWLRADDAQHVRTLEISFGTTLHALGRVGRFVRVVTPRGLRRRVASGAVVVHATGSAALQPSRRSLRRSAKTFLGLPYLWGGLSGFGMDCSGLTWLDYRAHGITIPRDALPQSRHGRRVSRPAVGDLLFYASNGLVHHVSMYIGRGYMIQAPHTGDVVRIVPFAQQPLRSEYAGARRYLP